MRYIDETIRARLLQAQKTLYNNANPSVDIIAVRPNTPIMDKNLWQESIVAEDTTATCTSVALRRVSGRSANRAYVAYITNGTLVVKTALLSYPSGQLTWTVVETKENCIACAIDFDGSFVREGVDKVEYLTDNLPWLFYVTSTGQLMAGILGSTYESLVGANVTAIDTIRGIASKYKNLDQGLLVFYIISGAVYYRDRIAGTWESQKAVSIAPENAVSIRAERTWDYRIVLQIKDTAGKLYEVFTKMEASSWNSTEFLALNSVKATGTLIDITRRTIENEIEAINLNDLVIDGWNMSIYSPILLSAENVEVSDDWGSRIKLTFDQCVKNATAWPAHFKFVDGHGATWYGQTASMTEKHSRFVYVDFINFNNASNPIVVTALAGQLTNGYTALAETSVEFDAQNLVPYPTDPPLFVDMHNTDNQTIIVEFDKEIIAVLSQTGFLVYGYEPAMSPEGDLVYTEYEVDLVEKISTFEIQISLTYAGRMKHPQGEVTLHFTGAIQGEDVSFVPTFEESFAPTDLVLWFNPNDPERLELQDIVVSGQITTITYPVHEQPPEDFLELSDVLAAGVLTHIDDLPE